jgi:hypothetical protein
LDNLHIAREKSSPEVSLDSETKVHYIGGESYPENTKSFYTPIIEWIEEFLSSLEDGEETVFNFEMIYFNSSSSKVLMDIFYILDDAVADDNKSVVINWIYDERNDSAEEYGEEFSEDLQNVTFNLVVK